MAKDNYKGRIVEVHRHFGLAQMSQTDPEVKAWFGMSYRAVGPYFKDKTTATGLSFEEQAILLPELLGIEHSDKDFRKTVTRFYDEMVTPIPANGIKLQVSLHNDTEPLSRTNLPININDYVRWRHIIGHPEVANDKADAERIFNKHFYIIDPDKVSVEAVTLNTLEDEAMVFYMKYKDDKIRLDQILTMLAIDIRSFDFNDKVLKLKSFATKNPKLNEVEQKEAFEKFLRICKDTDLEYKFLIQELIGSQHLQRAGNHIVYKETGEKLGENMQDAVLFLRNPKNSRQLNLLKAEYMKIKGADKKYLPGENEITESAKTE